MENINTLIASLAVLATVASGVWTIINGVNVSKREKKVEENQIFIANQQLELAKQGQDLAEEKQQLERRKVENAERRDLLNEYMNDAKANRLIIQENGATIKGQQKQLDEVNVKYRHLEGELDKLKATLEEEQVNAKRELQNLKANFEREIRDMQLDQLYLAVNYLLELLAKDGAINPDKVDANEVARIKQLILSGQVNLKLFLENAGVLSSGGTTAPKVIK